MSQFVNWLVCGIFLFASSPPLWSWSGSNLVVALKPDKDPESMLEERKALADYLSSQLQCDVDVIVPLSSAVISEGLRNGTIDVAYVSATEMALLEKSKAAELILANDFGGRTDYDSLWLVRTEAPYFSIEDLAGQPVAFSSRTSTSGFLIPLLDLKKRGKVAGPGELEDFFGRGNVFFGTGYVSAVEMVLAGTAQAAAVSDYVFLGDKHLAQDQKQKLRILQAQGPVPSHTLAVSSQIEPDDKKSVLNAFLALNEPEHRALRDRLFTASLVQVENHLSTVREALDAAGVEH